MSTETAEPTVEQWLNIDGYAALLGVPRATVRNAVTARRINFHRVGRHVRFSPADRLANESAWAPQTPIRTPAVPTVVRHLPMRRRAS